MLKNNSKIIIAPLHISKYITMPCTEKAYLKLITVKNNSLLTHFRPMFHLCRNQVVGL